MSVEATSWVWRHSRAVNPGDRLVMLAIADHAWPDGTNAYPGMARLAAYTGLSEPGVTLCIKRQIALGELRVVENGGGRGNRRGFVIVMDEDRDGPPSWETPNRVSPNSAGKTPNSAPPETPNSDSKTPNSAAPLYKEKNPKNQVPEPKEPKPPNLQRQKCVLDRLQERGIAYTLTKPDGRAIKSESGISPERIANAYAELLKRSKDDRFLANNLSVQTAIRMINALETPLAPRAAKRAPMAVEAPPTHAEAFKRREREGAERFGFPVTA